MTAAQLQRLAEQATTAHDFYRRTNPATARVFQDAAVAARRLAAELTRREQRLVMQHELDRLKAGLDGPDAA